MGSVLTPLTVGSVAIQDSQSEGMVVQNSDDRVFSTDSVSNSSIKANKVPKLTCSLNLHHSLVSPTSGICRTRHNYPAFVNGSGTGSHGVFSAIKD